MHNRSKTWKSPTIALFLIILAMMAALLLFVFKDARDRYGLTEQDRRKIYTEIVLAEDRGHVDANLAYPLPDIFSPQYALWRDSGLLRQQTFKNLDLANQLVERYRNEVLRRYGITPEQETEISVEAAKENWPLPEPLPGSD